MICELAIQENPRALEYLDYNLQEEKIYDLKEMYKLADKTNSYK